MKELLKVFYALLIVILVLGCAGGAYFVGEHVKHQQINQILNMKKSNILEDGRGRDA